MITTEDHGASMFNGEQVIDHIEEDDHTDNVVEDDDRNIIIRGIKTNFMTILYM